jgi:hypothetical protein
MEKWSIGLRVIGVFARIDRVRFFDDQRFGPCTGIAFSFQRFDQPEKAVFEFECLVIENSEIVFGELVCLARRDFQGCIRDQA